MLHAALILGGHDHKNSLDCVYGKRRCVAKADANDRTVYIHRLIMDPEASNAENSLIIESKLFTINEDIPQDPKIRSLIDCWFARAEGQFSMSGGSQMGLLDTVAQVKGEALDGTEESIRRRQGSKLTQLLAEAMLDHANKGNAGKLRLSFAVFNSGSIRIDDLIVNFCWQNFRV